MARLLHALDWGSRDERDAERKAARRAITQAQIVIEQNRVRRKKLELALQVKQGRAR
jgi:hypothetical protein